MSSYKKKQQQQTNVYYHWIGDGAWDGCLMTFPFLKI